MLEPPYDYWPIVARPPLVYPDGNRMACYLGLNIEHFYLGKPSTCRTPVTVGLPVDPLNYGWRDYGVRAGFWRMLEAMDDFGPAISVLLNSDAAVRYPGIVQAGVDRGWAFLGHGRTNSELWTGFAEEEERKGIAEIVATLTAATGKAPRGWLGPALTETAHSVEILRENGFTYSLDWVADDQPFPMGDEHKRFLSVPYSIEINDIPVFIDQAMTPAQFTQLIVDQFQVLYEESATRPGAVFSVSIHPFLVGQPFRFRHFAEALKEISSVPGVWYANTDQIAEWYLANEYDGALKSIAEFQRS
ncbi:polysaccharide deacetylase family protein [Pseudonocardia hispaniensis]|uniref:Polysaccharide deacetylase family protein n=1 Tax=Pseudonocardia hispaniensis TaxID=904933 RepID=A0ABW1IYI9_9PSEU